MYTICITPVYVYIHVHIHAYHMHVHIYIHKGQLEKEVVWISEPRCTPLRFTPNLPTDILDV